MWRFGVALGEQVEGCTLLLVARPEHHGTCEQRHHDERAVALGAGQAREEQQVGEVADPERQHDPGGRGPERDRVQVQRAGRGEERDQGDGADEEDHRPPRGALGGRMSGVAEVAARLAQLDETDRHAERGDAEAPVPAEPRGEQRHEERAQEGARVDAHVEEGEARVAPRAPFRIQRRHQRAHVGLQEPDAEHDDDEADEEERGQVREAREGEHEVARGDQYAAGEHRPLPAEEPIGDPAPGEPEQIGASEVEPVDRVRRLVIEPEAALGGPGDEEQDEHRAHPVEGEALPHLGEEQRPQAPRLAEERRALGAGQGVGGDLVHQGCGKSRHEIAAVSPGSPCRRNADPDEANQVRDRRRARPQPCGALASVSAGLRRTRMRAMTMPPS